MKASWSPTSTRAFYTITPHLCLSIAVPQTIATITTGLTPTAQRYHSITMVTDPTPWAPWLVQMGVETRLASHQMPNGSPLKAARATVAGILTCSNRRNGSWHRTQLVDHRMMAIQRSVLTLSITRGVGVEGISGIGHLYRHGGQLESFLPFQRATRVLGLARSDHQATTPRVSLAGQPTATIQLHISAVVGPLP